ncbi:uncharacterized protein EV422DRAFT_565465 [Fimicolochytrium jonesii]|uniref:uncharacterized protein n=1 Tax=Fimicolochytrium jonesii TaxID=1396493 RepID=UPI0022FE1AF7|nr:uncharacterized protein EV422DRAFT_565465 [Fimicolochytrium jonesii]KAI8823522.1 hypothetical protein EV422DRAFT_565465 [Fimicolochytrium jonesii]
MRPKRLATWKNSTQFPASEAMRSVALSSGGDMAHGQSRGAGSTSHVQADGRGKSPYEPPPSAEKPNRVDERSDKRIRSSYAPQDAPRPSSTSSSEAASKTAKGPETKPDVIIHVYDESKKAKRDYFCDRILLLRQMPYFSPYLLNHAAEATIEIDVHCDIQVFEWLMLYISRKRPLFEPRLALSILVSSNFLQMAALEDQCLSYIHQTIDDVLKVSTDMTCLNQPLVDKLAKLFTVNELENVHDIQDKILGQIYFCKLRDLLAKAASEDNFVCACRLCGRLYTEKRQLELLCHEAPLRVGYDGDVTRCHQRDVSFNINDFMTTLYAANVPWKESYWMFWGLLHHLHCSKCDQTFACGDYKGCWQHASEATYPPKDGANGYHACCGASAQKFDPFKTANGCKQVAHVPNVTSGEVYSTFKDHMDHIIRSSLRAVFLEITYSVETKPKPVDRLLPNSLQGDGAHAFCRDSRVFPNAWGPSGREERRGSYFVEDLDRFSSLTTISRAARA